MNLPYFGELLAWGLAAGLGASVGLEAPCCVAAGAAGAPGEAGRNPRLPGLVNMFAARLLLIFASFIATSSKAALRISFRWLIKA